MPQRYPHAARVFRLAGLALCLLAALPRGAPAAWPAGNESALRIAPADSFTPPMTVSDSAGGMFVVWQAPGGVLRCQRYDSEGVTQWKSGGVSVTSRPGFAIGTRASSDAQGGVLVAWMFNGDISHVYAQRLSGSGEPMWGTAGVEPAPSTFDQRGASILAGQDGGALMLWMHTPAVGAASVRIQHFAFDGSTQWGESGLSLSSTTGFVGVPVAVPDGAGGVHAVWPTYANFDSTDVDLLYQHVTTSGELLTPAGTYFCDAPGAQLRLVGAAAPGGDAVYAWEDTRDEAYSMRDIRVQRISPKGVKRWEPWGLPACAHSWAQSRPALAVTPDGVAWCAWTDDRFGGGVYDVPSVFVQAIGADGEFLLPEFGLRVASAPGSRSSVNASPDGRALVEWVPATGGIRVQKVDAGAGFAWGDSGVALTRGAIRTHGAGAHLSGSRAVTVWVAQLDSSEEARAQVIGLDGAVGSPELVGVPVASGAHSPLRVFGTPTRAGVSFESPARDLRVFDSAGRTVARLTLQRRGDAWAGHWNLGSDEGRRVPAGLYFVRVEGAPGRPGRVVVLPR